MIGKVHILGILNLTPDSFYAGSRIDAGSVAADYVRLLADGADRVDIGACSTRPGAAPVSEDEEWARLEPALKALSGVAMPGTLSLDTFRPGIVQRAHGIIGPFLVNDISGGEPLMLETVAQLDLPYVATYPGPVPDISAVQAFFDDFSRRANAAGIREWLADPGFGFGKSLEENWRLLRQLGDLQTGKREILVGVSRKSMIYKLLNITPEEALAPTQVVQFAALERGATWLRVHDVAAAVQTARLYCASSTR